VRGLCNSSGEGEGRAGRVESGRAPPTCSRPWTRLAPSHRRGVRHRAAGEERSRAGRLRRGRDEGRARCEDDHAAHATEAVADLGSWQGAVCARAVQRRDRVAVYFADPHSPWQRGTNENTNGLLRQYFPKGTDLSRWSAEEIESVAAALNSRPRKVLGWKTPAEALDEQLRLTQQASVASTD